MKLQKKRLLLPYDPKWPGYFYQEKKWLCRFFNPLRICHVGSTAVRGIRARPIIDIVLEIESIDFLYPHRKELESFGYSLQDNTLYKELNHPNLQGFSIQVFHQGNEGFSQQVALCDYLQAFDEEASKFSKLKIDAGDLYEERKRAFFEKTQPKADRWKEEIERLYPYIEKNALVAASSFTNSDDRSFVETKFGAHLLQSDTPDSFWNFVYGTRLKDKKDLDEICKSYIDRKVSMSYWVLPWDSPSNLATLLEAKGFLLKNIEQGMICKISEIKTLDDLEIVRVVNEEQLRDFNHIQSSDLSTIYEKATLAKNKKMQYFLGIQNKKVVTSGTIVETVPIYGIYSIKTLPEERKKGYATALVKGMIKKACNVQNSFVFLQASQQGENLYTAIGFQRFSSFYEYRYYL